MFVGIPTDIFDDWWFILAVYACMFITVAGMMAVLMLPYIHWVAVGVYLAEFFLAIKLFLQDAMEE